MFLPSMEEATSISASLIWKQKHFQACELLGIVCCSYFEPNIKNRTFPSNRTLSRNSNDFSVVPVQEKWNIACPGQEEEFFTHPWRILPHKNYNCEIREQITERIRATCEATCLFNVGLAHHLAGIRGNTDPAKMLQRACVFYGLAWDALRMFLDDITIESEDATTFLIMAISINIANCYYHLGQVDSCNQSMEFLNELLRVYQASDDDLSTQLHGFSS